MLARVLLAVLLLVHGMPLGAIASEGCGHCAHHEVRKGDHCAKRPVVAKGAHCARRPPPATSRMTAPNIGCGCRQHEAARAPSDPVVSTPERVTIAAAPRSPFCAASSEGWEDPLPPPPTPPPDDTPSS